VHDPAGRTILQAPFIPVGRGARDRICTCTIDLGRARRLRRSSYLPDRRPETYRSLLAGGRS
jgi:hypothetical protein